MGCWKKGYRRQRGNMIHTEYPSYKETVSRRYKCVGCGKNRSKSVTEQSWLSPFVKKNKDGSYPTEEEFEQRVKKKAQEAMDEFMADPRCTKCEV